MLRASCILLCLGALVAVAHGTIVIDSFPIQTGIAPRRGRVRVLPDAPWVKPPPTQLPLPFERTPNPLEPIQEIGSIGQGDMGEFLATEDAVMFGGIREYTSYTIPSGITVNYQGDAEIRVLGDVAIAGSIHCDGNLIIRSGTRICVQGGSAGELDGRVFARGQVEIYGSESVVIDDAQIVSDTASVCVLCHQGWDDATQESSIAINSGGTLDAELTIDVRSSGSIDISAAAQMVARKNLVLISGKAVRASGEIRGSMICVNGDIDIEFGRGSGAAQLQGNVVSVSCASGPVVIDRTRVRSKKAVSITAHGSIEVGGNSELISSRVGRIELASSAGKVIIAEQSHLRAGSRGFVASAHEALELKDSSIIATNHGGVVLQSRVAFVSFTRAASVSGTGDVDVRSDSGIYADSEFSNNTNVPDLIPMLSGKGVSISCSSGAIDLDCRVDAGRRGLYVHSGTWVKTGDFTSRGVMRVVSGAQGVSVQGVLQTGNRRSSPTGTIWIDAYDAEDPVIRIERFAELRTGKSAVRSGDVVLRTFLSDATGP